MTRLLVVLSVLVGLVGCGGSGDGPSDVAGDTTGSAEVSGLGDDDGGGGCAEASSSMIGRLRGQLSVPGAELESARIVETALALRNDNDWPTHVLAARIVGDGVDGEVGVWGISPDAFMPVALNDVAIAHTLSTWGDDPSTPEGQQRMRLAGSAEAAAVASCVSG